MSSEQASLTAPLKSLSSSLSDTLEARNSMGSGGEDWLPPEGDPVGGLAAGGSALLVADC